MERYHLTWRGIDLTVTFHPNRFGAELCPVDHIEIEAAGRVPLPVTATGYRSHFLAAGSVADLGGPAAFVTAWLDHEAARGDRQRPPSRCEMPRR